MPSALPRRSDVAIDTRYRIGEILGKGGMGEVRLAKDMTIDRDVAIKLMHDAKDQGMVARFFHEARVQGQLEHPAVVPVHDLGIDATGHPYFVMKRLAGTTLFDVLAKREVCGTRGRSSPRWCRAARCSPCTTATRAGSAMMALKHRQMQDRALDVVHTQSWHLQQLLPERADGEPAA